MPEYTYIPHKVKKGETLWGIAKQYGVEEHKIVQANPEIKITPKGKGKYDIANLKEGQVIKIPQKAKEKTKQKQGVKAIIGNPKPTVGNTELYKVLEWYEATPQSYRNPAKVKWVIHKQNSQGKYVPHESSKKTGKGEFTFNEQSLGQKIKVTGYLFTPELYNESTLDLKIQKAEKRSIIEVALKDVYLKPLPKPYKLTLGQTFFVTVRTASCVGNRVVIQLMRKKVPQAPYHQENSKEEADYELYQQQIKIIKENGQATAYFKIDDFKLLMNPQKTQKYNIVAYLEESREVTSSTPVEAENTPTKKTPENSDKNKENPKEKKVEEENIIYKGVSLLKEGWNSLKETYKEMTTSDDPQIERVKLEIPEGKTKITYEDSLTLKIEGRNLKDKTLEYTLYEDDVASKDELQKGTHTLKGDTDSLKIQLNKEMYQKGGTSWFEIQDGKHEVFVEIGLKGTKISKSSGIIDVDISQYKHDIPQNESVAVEGVPEQEEEEQKCPRCDKDITLEELQAVFTSASTGNLGVLLKSLNTYRKKFELNTCAKKAHFFAQCIEESGRNLTGALKGEDLGYTPEGLVKQFDNFRSKHVKGSSMQNTVYMGYSGEQLAYKDRKKSKPTAEAYKYGKYNGHEANERMIANIAYNGRNGNAETGNDGWNFKGRGLLQITGKNNYAAVQKVIDKRAPESKVDVFASVSDSGYTPLQASVTGMAEWVQKGLYAIASKATKDNDDEVVNSIVDSINKKTASRAKRIVHYRGGSATAKIPETIETVSYTAPKDKNGSPKYKPTKEIFRIDECILLTGKKKEKKKEEKMAPWIPFAVKELEKYGGIRQQKTPLKERVVKYFRVSKDTWDDHTGYWCGAFVRWCFAQTEDYNYVFDSYNSVTAFNWLSPEHTTNKGTHSKRTKDVEAILDLKDIFVGAIIVFDYSHVAFVVGQSTDGNSIFYLGGNQSDKAPGDGPRQRTICIGKISKTKFHTNFWLSKPKKYEPTEEEKDLPKLKVSAYELDYSSTR